VSAPTAVEHSAALDRLARALLHCLGSAAERQATDTPSADHRRPVAPAIDATTPSPQPASRITRTPLEDADRGHATNRDD
jgi:hypothetical protein